MTTTGKATTRFDAQCRTVAELLIRSPSGGEHGEADMALASVRAELPSLLNGRLPAGQDPEDVAQEAMLKFIVAIRQGKVNPAKSPAGYLLRIASNIAKDALRRGPAPDPLPDPDAVHQPGTAEDLDRVSWLIDSLASVDLVRGALTHAYTRGDTVALDVVHAWLNLADSLGEAPPSRAVAETVGVSKTTVAKVLLRFRTYLDEIS